MATIKFRLWYPVLAGAVLAVLATAASRTPVPERARESGPGPRIARALLGGSTFHLEIAESREAQARGLSGRMSIPPDGGMLFLFGAPRYPVFGMKGMAFPIDIIWLRGQRIVAIHERVPAPAPETPDSALGRFSPPEPVGAVVEVRAGTAKELGLSPGQEVRILLP